MASHQKAMDTQIAQIALQVSHLFRPQGHLPCKFETNPQGHINALSIACEGVKESPVMLLLETVVVPDSVRTDEEKEKRKLSLNREVIPPPPVRLYQPPAPYPQRVAWPKLFQCKPKFMKFLDMLRRIYADIPFLEALRKTPTYIQSLRELVSKKDKHGGPSVVPIGEVCSLILQSQSPPKVQDPGSFSIPYARRDLPIEGALYDLGASMSLMPLSLYTRLQLQDLQPTSLSIQLANRSIRQPSDTLEDIPVQVG